VYTQERLLFIVEFGGECSEFLRVVFSDFGVLVACDEGFVMPQMLPRWRRACRFPPNFELGFEFFLGYCRSMVECSNLFGLLEVLE
jgi:hypothetical protein